MSPSSVSQWFLNTCIMLRSNKMIMKTVIKQTIKWVHEEIIIITSIVFFLSIGWEPTTWPANNCLQLMVCSCVVPSKRVLLQIILWAARQWLKYGNKLGDRMISKLLNSAIARYRDLSVSRRSIIDQLANDRSRYFAQPRPMIVNYFCWIINAGSYFVKPLPSYYRWFCTR